ncbi:SPFH/Band 7/PHB domain protein [Desulfonema ishimotonii]|uniref:SPFH/Band 7/PHB domain protein n=1 Tax=Desulfonema ishimotonii TaxID=45657 RepID=A0A401G1Q2_9BACT|nr:SPFH domain-containing protein [Desulfonema ishimotonii]GBC63141.1 SPFH/Band 7/PHB domain protein [Desulfonema ishimotonii]
MSYYVLIVVMVLGITAVWVFQTVPQGENYVIERFGKFSRVIRPGVNLMIPYADQIRAKVLMKDQPIEIPTQDVITNDNVVIKTNAIAFIRVMDPEKAIYEIENYAEAISSLIQTALRGVIGDMKLDDALSSREVIKNHVIQKITPEVSEWGIRAKTVEIKDINPSESMQQSMEQQAAAERRRRATIAEALGDRTAAILNADGKKEAMIREAQANLEASRSNADAARILSKATEESLEKVNQAVRDARLSAFFLLGENYIRAMRDLANSPNAKIVVLPPDLLNSVKSFFPKE